MLLAKFWPNVGLLMATTNLDSKTVRSNFFQMWKLAFCNVHSLWLFNIYVKFKTHYLIKTLFIAYLRIQEDDSLLCDVKVNPCALVSSSLLDFLGLGSEHIAPMQTSTHANVKTKEHTMSSLTHWFIIFIIVQSSICPRMCTCMYISCIFLMQRTYLLGMGKPQ